MANHIVTTVAETLFASGISTLRFNFRGVGKSSGTFEGGPGEQDDVLTAISFMAEQGIRDILTAGYSFGAWVNAGILGRRKMLPALFVSPPLSLFDFDFQALRGKVGLIVCGDQDQYCPTERLKSFAAELDCRLNIIPAADHFFQSREQCLASSIQDFATQAGYEKIHTEKC